MENKLYRAGIALLLAGFMLSCSHKTMKEQALTVKPMSDEQASNIENVDQLAREAYTFGYPLVLMDSTRQISSSVSSGAWSGEWMDLSEGPMVISVPEMVKRFYSGNLFNGWADLTTVIGTRTTGNHKADFVVVGPNWTGDLPANMTVIESSTNLAWFPVQIESAGGKKETAKITQLRKGFKITPLTQWTGESTLDRSIASNAKSELDTEHSPSDQVFAMDAATFYGRLCHLMVTNPPDVADSPLMLQLRALGIQPTENFDLAKLPPQVRQALISSTENSKDFILAHEGDLGPSEAINGWTIHTNMTNFGTDYDRRAFVAATALGAGSTQDVMNYTISNDNLGQKMNGQYRYQINFDKGQLPPVKASWTLTSSGTQLMLGSHSHLRRNADGTVTLYIQRQPVTKARRANWLKAPKDDFQLSLQLYWPKQSAVDMKWEPPMVERVTETSPLVMATELVQGSN